MPGPPRRTTARGEKRRALLVQAAGELLLEEGFGAVSHRAVAERAGLPLAATTYYFASREELVGQATAHLAERWMAAAELAVTALPAQLSGATAVSAALLRVVAAPATARPPAALLTFYERYLEAGRSPLLRSMIKQYDGQLDALLLDVLRRGGIPAAAAGRAANAAADVARLVLAVVDGALLRALAEGEPVDAAAAPVQALIALLIDSRPA